MIPTPVCNIKPALTLSAGQRPLVVRLLFVLPFVAALGIVFWSLQRIRPVLKETAAISERVNRISSQIDDMERARLRAEQAGVPQRFQDTLASYVEGENALSDWLTDLREKAAPLALTVTSTMGEPVVSNVGGQELTLIPVHLEIRPTEDVGSIRSAYQRLIEFCQFIALHPRRADVSELTVSGSTGAMSRAVLTLNLWARRPVT